MSELSTDRRCKYLAALQSYGVKEVFALFECRNEGDGSIDCIVVDGIVIQESSEDHNPKLHPEHRCLLWDYEAWGEANLDATLHDLVDSFAYELLEASTEPHWRTADSQGRITIVPSTGHIDIDFKFVETKGHRSIDCSVDLPPISA